MVGGIAQFEREIMRERQREGIAKAKAEGKHNASALGLTTAPGNFIPNAKDQ